MCRQTLSILTWKKVRTILSNYVLNKWRMDVRRRNSYISVHFDDLLKRLKLLDFVGFPNFHEIVGM